MNRRFIAGSLAALLLSSSFVSCGDNDKDVVVDYEKKPTPEQKDPVKDPNNNVPNEEQNNTKEEEDLVDFDNIDFKHTPLKYLVDRNKCPNFKVACGVEYWDFINPQNWYYNIVPEHFNECSAGNQFKMDASVNRDNGSMNFDGVKKFIARAEECGVTVFGHTFAWHSQQPTNYLKSKIANLKTADERRVAAENEMARWIDGMLKACDGKVKAWDAVNEALGGSDEDNDGKYDLQTYERLAPNNPNKENVKNNFYWQDYLGDKHYVPFVVNTARASFKKYGGNPDELKLFVNDYNLESSWDDNGKLKSLIKWIDVWESEGCYIDGIASQMHISCYEKDEWNNNVKAHITKMLELMAATGKLVKISELDMGYRASLKSFWDPGLKTSELKDYQKERMADLYEFVVSEYFRIVPAAQQYGITQWALTDSPVNSGWIPNEPIGLWTLDNHEKKPAYYGFARGLVYSHTFNNDGTSKRN